MSKDDLFAGRPSRRLPPVRIVGIDTEPMTSEQYEAAVEALAVLITEWTGRGDKKRRGPPTPFCSAKVNRRASP